jgi:hypothetical protein
LIDLKNFGEVLSTHQSLLQLGNGLGSILLASVVHLIFEAFHIVEGLLAGVSDLVDDLAREEREDLL